MYKLKRTFCFLLAMAVAIGLAPLNMEAQAAASILTVADFKIETTTVADPWAMSKTSNHGERISFDIGGSKPGYQLEGFTSIWRHSGDWWSRVNHFGINQAGIHTSDSYYSHVTDEWSQIIADGGGSMAAYWGWGKYGATKNKYNVKDNGKAHDSSSGKEGVVSVQNYYFNEYLPTEAHEARIPIPKEVAKLMEEGTKVTPVIYMVNDPGNPTKHSLVAYDNLTVTGFYKDADASGGNPGKYSFRIKAYYPKVPVDDNARTTLDYMTNGVKSNGSYNSEYTIMVNNFEKFNGQFSAFPGAVSLHQGDYGGAGNGLAIIDATNGNHIGGVSIKGANRVGTHPNGTWSAGGAIGISLNTRIYVMYYATPDDAVQPKAAYTYVNEYGAYIDPSSGTVVSAPVLTSVPTTVTRVDGADYWDANWNIPKTAKSDTIIGITSVENSPVLGSAYSQTNPGRTVETKATLGVTINDTSLPVTITGAVTSYREGLATINETTSKSPDADRPVFTDSSKTGSATNNFYNYANTDNVLYKVMVYTKPPYDPPPEVEPVFWANYSKAFAEVKQGTYSDNRATEAWEAMAGVPHDENMYVNAGASAILMAVSRTTAHSSAEWKTTNSLPGDPSLRSQSTSGNFGYSATANSCSVYPTATHCASVCNGAWCHGCTIGICHNGCGTNHPIPCSHYTPSSGTPGQPGYSPGGYAHANDGYYNYGAHHNCSAGSCPDRTGSDTKPISQFSLYYYIIDSYKYYRPESFTLNTSFFPSAKTFTSSLNTSLSQSNASMSVANNTKAFTYNTCGLLKANFTNDANNHYKNEARPTASFTPQKFSLTDINSNVYNYLGTQALSFTGSYDAAENTIIYTNNANNRKMHKSKVSNDNKHLYADEVPAYSTSRTNWMPHVESWNNRTKVPERGYAGNPTSSTRNTAGTLFYGAGYPLSTLLPNGPYTSSASPVQWRLQGSGGANAKILPIFNAPTVLRMTNVVVEPTYSMSAGYAESGSFTTVPNSIIVHSPNALGEMKVSQLLLSGQTYIEPDSILTEDSHVLESHVRLGQSFKLNWNHEWSASPRMSNRGILEIDARTWGNATQGYIVGLDTLRWIAAKYIRFSYEVIHNGTRYAANAWITVPRAEMISTFHVPISNEEDFNGYYETKVVAYNAPGGANPNSTDVETVQNITRTAFKAKHGAIRTYLTSVLGTIGNFSIQYTTDPNWKDYFASKYVGTGQNMFGFKSDNAIGRYLDPFNTIPLLNKAPTSSKPIVPGNNGNKNNEPIKMGYPIYYSLQTVGNYKDCTMRVDANYRVVKYSGGTTSYIDVDLYYRDGNTYKKLFPNAEGSIISTNVLNNSTYPVSGLEQSNSTSWGGISFASGNKTNILGPGLFKLPISLRTLIGYTRDYTFTTQYPTGGNHTLRQHAENAQRWHGVIYLPSSTVAVPRGATISDSNIIKGNGVMLTVELKFMTVGGDPFNLTLNDGTMYSPTPGKITVTTIPPGSTTPVPIDFPPDTVVVFDINKNSSLDGGSSGTH